MQYFTLNPGLRTLSFVYKYLCALSFCVSVIVYNVWTHPALLSNNVPEDLTQVEFCADRNLIYI
jgi:hypothetical protein